jgi:hypothetical protein
MAVSRQVCGNALAGLEQQRHQATFKQVRRGCEPNWTGTQHRDGQLLFFIRHHFCSPGRTRPAARHVRIIGGPKAGRPRF